MAREEAEQIAQAQDRQIQEALARKNKRGSGGFDGETSAAMASPGRRAPPDMGGIRDSGDRYRDITADAYPSEYRSPGRGPGGTPRGPGRKGFDQERRAAGYPGDDGEIDIALGDKGHSFLEERRKDMDPETYEIMRDLIRKDPQFADLRGTLQEINSSQYGTGTTRPQYPGKFPQDSFDAGDDRSGGPRRPHDDRGGPPRQYRDEYRDDGGNREVIPVDDRQPKASPTKARTRLVQDIYGTSSSVIGHNTANRGDDHWKPSGKGVMTDRQKASIVEHKR